MRSPKTKTLCFVIVGLVVLSFVNMWPIDAKYRMTADHTIVATTTTAEMWKINGFGYSMLIVAGLLLVWVLLRVGLTLFHQSQERRNEKS
jgi:hypothetical protein